MRRLRRASCLTLYWEGKEFVVTNYLSGKQVVTQPALCQILQRLMFFTNRHEVEHQFAVVPDSRNILLSLIDADILLQEGSAIERKDRRIDRVWKWGQNARFFHFSTQEVHYTFDHERVRSHFERKAKTHPPPSPFKELAGDRIPLSASYADRDGGLWSALAKRRTVRNFERRPISFSQLSTVLLWTWGMTRYFNESRLDRRILKTSPSGGARHVIEVYPVVQRVEGLEPGIYHYSVEHNALTMLRPGVFEDRMVEFYSGQYWIKNAAVLVILTAVLPRSMWKYDHSRAYRVMHLDAGHIGQTFHLVATALGLGVFTTAALQDRQLEEMLSLDGVTETVLYGGGIGHCASDTRKRPSVD